VLRIVSDAVQDIGLTRDEIFAFEQPGTIDGADRPAWTFPFALDPGAKV
jgi:hypothetical protein